MHLHPDEDPVLARARKRVAMKLGFYIHLAVFLLVNAAFLTLGWATAGSAGSTGNGAALRWGHWPLWGWAIGLCMHGLFTFLSLQGEGFRDRMIQREAQRLREQQQRPQSPSR